LLDGNLAVSSRHGLVTHLGLPHTVAAAILWGQWISQNLIISTRMGSSVPSHSSTTNTARSLAGLRLGRMWIRLLSGSSVSASASRRPWIRSS
jgi:hypothetical protein